MNTMSQDAHGSVEQLTLVACSECGAGVPVRSASADCVFCGTPVTLNPAIEQLIAMPAEANAAREEGVRALREAFAARHGVHRGTMLWAGVVAVFVWLGSLGIADFVTGDSRAATAPFLWMVLPALVGGAAFLAFVHLRARRLARARSAQAKDAALLVAHRAHCPECAHAVMVPAHTAFMRCAACHSPLLASQGMLVGWVENAVERTQRWRRQAEAIVLAAEKEHAISLAKAAAAFVVVPLFVVTLLMIGLKGLAFAGFADPTGDRVQLEGKDAVVLAQYGKLLQIKTDEGDMWIESQDVRLKPRKRAAGEPEDSNRWARGDEVVCDNHPRETAEVRETHGHMVRVERSDRSGYPIWLRDRACRKPKRK